VSSFLVSGSYGQDTNLRAGQLIHSTGAGSFKRRRMAFEAVFSLGPSVVSEGLDTSLVEYFRPVVGDINY